MNKATDLFSILKKYSMSYLLRGLNLIIYIMIKANLSPFVYFIEILMDKSKVNKKLSHKQIRKKLRKVN